ncbi:MAG: gas vesicle synthesis GvpLGvpF [Candidatus Magnetoglobus multicellularis str. Araruama]|uniref:Gas vesicle synthesis GvpLGvpF n=1 Tax=Candidatus Magnetoglobus multicellularis str. Araruama TaxID=890399 RepID=A0A1V1NTD4_9BACT|nr:MAG: gas vesicle synthesis GvpLGvpF [Candidatus Magnetoglobus multicellularis str. Araruama]
MTLKVSWIAPNIFKYFTDKYQELRKMRDTLYKSNKNITPNDKIELGRRFNKFLNEEREIHTHTIEKALSPICDEIKFLSCRDEHLVLHAACLIHKDREKQFEDAIFQAANQFDDNFQFDYNGPFIPHNFSDLNIDL